MTKMKRAIVPQNVDEGYHAIKTYKHTVSRHYRKQIKDQWRTILWDNLEVEYPAFNRVELYAIKYGHLKEKYAKDVDLFCDIIVDVKLQAAKSLYERDQSDKDWDAEYLTDPANFADFATYSGSECRKIYRTWYAFCGYDSFNGYGSLSYSFDCGEIAWWVEQFSWHIQDAILEYTKQHAKSDHDYDAKVTAPDGRFYWKINDDVFGFNIETRAMGIDDEEREIVEERIYTLWNDLEPGFEKLKEGHPNYNNIGEEMVSMLTLEFGDKIVITQEKGKYDD